MSIGAFEIGDQRFERLDHMPVAQIPGRHVRQEHRPGVRFRVPDQTRVLLGVEEFVPRDSPVALRVGGRAPLQVDEDSDDVLSA